MARLVPLYERWWSHRSGLVQYAGTSIPKRNLSWLASSSPSSGKTVAASARVSRSCFVTGSAWAGLGASSPATSTIKVVSSARGAMDRSYQSRTSGSECVRTGADHQDLVDAHPAVAEGHRPADQVELPDADDLLAHQLDEPAAVAVEVVQPAGDGQHVVLAQPVHVADLEAGALEEADGLADRAHVHVGRDEALDERAAAGPLAGPRHLLDEHPAARLDRAVQDLGVRRVVVLADVLAHLDRGHRVVGADRSRGSRGAGW